MRTSDNQAADLSKGVGLLVLLAASASAGRLMNGGGF
jgi:hypothetical protein